jgi:hypothetical protein
MTFDPLAPPSETSISGRNLVALETSPGQSRQRSRAIHFELKAACAGLAGLSRGSFRCARAEACPTKTPTVVLARPRKYAVRTVIRAAALLLALVPACASQGHADDPRARAEATNQHLNGQWTLVEFQPEIGLEPMLAQLLSAQIGRLAVQFDGSRMTATGVGVQAVRTYRIDDASADGFSMTLFDQIGVTYSAQGTFDGNLVRFQSLTSPWNGHGVLRRGSP